MIMKDKLWLKLCKTHVQLNPQFLVMINSFKLWGGPIDPSEKVTYKGYVFCILNNKNHTNGP